MRSSSRCCVVHEAELDRRIKSTVERNDLMVNALAAKEKFGTSYEELRSQATTLVYVLVLAEVLYYTD